MAALASQQASTIVLKDLNFKRQVSYQIAVLSHGLLPLACRPVLFDLLLTGSGDNSWLRW